jgi:hypothetical protein
MKTKCARSLVLWCGSFFLALVVSLGAQTALAMTVLQPSETTVTPGGDFSIEVDDASFDPVALLGVDVDISFDQTLFKLTNVGLGSWVADGGSATFESTTGKVSICCWLGGGTGNSIFTAFFHVLRAANPGPGEKSTVVSFATDSGAVNDPTEYQVDPDPSSLTLMVSALPLPIPEPATWALLIIGFVGATFVRRSLGVAGNRSWRRS